MVTPLIIYKASAGSGKTFTLATEYIKLIVRNPHSYRQILAVTFTNKATEEMKMRILSQLYGIWRGLPSSAGYARKVEQELEATPEYVARQAGIALTNLLHNYSYFRVETIDSFFQSVLRNLARELDLTANLRIGLNDAQVEELAVDELIENLTATDLMLKWLLRYIMDTISDDRSWNVISQIKKFGKTIFRDYYKSRSKALYQTMAAPDFFEHYTATLRDIRQKARRQMSGIADSFFQELESAGFTVDDLSYGKSGVAGIFVKMSEGTFDSSIITKRVTDSIGQPEKWYKKTHPRREELYILADGVLGRLLRQAVDEQPRQWRLYQSADLTLRHLEQLRLLESIEKKVRQLNDDANRFLLSDTQQLLHELIEGSDSPFIFEKIGTQLEHIMIDEFQDTSTVQWQNFKVLLQETMSHEDTENLIVGDVKQSIYRWRSGDWRLLSNIKEQFPNAEWDTSGEARGARCEVRTLDTNYRSARNIVEFNNAFFTKAAELEGVTAYDDVVQKVPERESRKEERGTRNENSFRGARNEEGGTRIDSSFDTPRSKTDLVPPSSFLLPRKTKEGRVIVSLLPSEDYEQNTLDRLIEDTASLLDMGTPPADIAILVRANSQIPLIANYFMAHLPEVRIVSDEAFRLDASPAVQVIIQALKWLTHPDDTLAKAFLAKAYAHRPLHEGTLDDMLPEAFTGHTEDLLRMPLYDLTERLYVIFRLDEMEGQSAYLCAFYDQVANYVNEQSTDIPSFLREWEDGIGQKTIQSPETDGIRLISIHKSKGLEFPHVFIPFCDWRLEHNDILWCQPQEEPFSQLPIVPIDYSQKGMTGTVYEKDYQEEHQQNTVDNMNLLYVAFTRASKSLTVIGKRNARNSRSALLEQVLPEMALEDAVLSGEEDKEAPLTMTYGELAAQPQAKKAGRQEENVFLQESQPQKVDIRIYEQKVAFRQSNKSLHFSTSEDDDEQMEQNRYIQMGTVLHEVFSTIRSTADIDDALKRMELDGIIYDQSLSKERIGNMIRKRLEDPRVAAWFAPRQSDGWHLFNECTILAKDPLTGNTYERRPDRVMTDGQHIVVVDFKFGKPRDEYHDQVREYMQLLTQMGYADVKGYLWFVYSNKIIEVK